MSLARVARSRPWLTPCRVLGVAAFLVAPLRMPGQNVEEMREFQKKAECLMNFTRFIEWPERRFPAADAPFVIGVFGADRITTLLRETLQGRPLKGRPVIIRHLSTNDELSTCHLLFVSRSAQERLGPLLRSVQGRDILTVGECDDFLGKGGVINFETAGEVVRFQISAGAAARENLAISSRLLQLSTPNPRPSKASAEGRRSPDRLRRAVKR